MAFLEYSHDNELHCRDSIYCIVKPENFGKECHGERVENRKSKECDLRAAVTTSCSLVEDDTEDSG